MSISSLLDDAKTALPEAERLGQSVFYLTPQGIALEKATRWGKIVTIIFLVVFLIFLGLTIWRTTLGAPKNTDATSITLYVITCLLFVCTIASFVAFTYGKHVAQKHLDRPGEIIRSFL